jgi:hypothetical protein
VHLAGHLQVAAVDRVVPALDVDAALVCGMCDGAFLMPRSVPMRMSRRFIEILREQSLAFISPP